MGAKMAPIYTTLTLAYLEENLYEIISKKYNHNIKQNLLDDGKVTQMMVSYSWNAYGATLTIQTTYPKTYTQNKIHYGTQF